MIKRYDVEAEVIPSEGYFGPSAYVNYFGDNSGYYLRTDEVKLELENQKRKQN